MASTAIKSEEEKREYFDSPEVLDQKCEKLANMILASEHTVAFTGAGISTACGIPDYRSGAYTVLPTGPGCWEKAANIQKARKEGKCGPAVKIDFKRSIAKSMPSKCHMSLVELMRLGHLKHIISQNIDGLHLKSGVPQNQISELHGNTNLEFCKKCGKGYYRDFRVRTANLSKEHKTGRKCEKTNCGGDLCDSIINFGECLREDILNEGYEQGFKADLHIVLGSSLRVSPANDMVSETKRNGGKIVHINLQKTPQDYEADFVIHGLMDNVMEILMEKLHIKIPEFRLQRWAKVSLTNKNTVKVQGIDQMGEPFTLFPKVQVNGTPCRENNVKTSNQPVKVDLQFQGHYDEPNLIMNIPYQMLEENKALRINMTYNPYKRTWESVKPYTLEKVLINQKIQFNDKQKLGGSTSSTASSSPAQRASSINRTSSNNTFSKQAINRPQQRAVSQNKTGLPPRFGVKAN